MKSSPRPQALTVVVGAGGVGKTTIAAALGLRAAEAGRDALVMTFDPARRLKDALGVGDSANDREATVPGAGPGVLRASLLDPGRTFDRLVERYAPDAAARDRILGNRFYAHLAGSLAGILEYMAVERLLEVADEGRYDGIVLDTPPTRQALDFLEAPERIVSFLDSGALRVALKPWFRADGRLRATSRLGPLGRGAERFLDDLVGLGLLRDMAEFFQAFAPLYDGFRDRALAVQRLLRAPQTQFVLVAGAAPERVADTLFFARKLAEAGHRLGAVVINQVHPRLERLGSEVSPGRRLFAWLGERDAVGVAQLKGLLAGHARLATVPMLATEPTDLAALRRLAAALPPI
ncbi:MAG: ArsA-related P-loop ATPase [Acidobacteriota bacterium]